MSSTRRFYSNYSFSGLNAVSATTLIGSNNITSGTLSVLNMTAGPCIISIGNISTNLGIPSSNVLRLRTGTDNNHSIQYNNAGFGNIGAGDIPGLIIKGWGGGLIGNSTSGPYLYWNSNSRIGINTTSPSSTLDLNNNDMSAKLLSFNNKLNFVTSGNNLITLYSSGNNQTRIGVSDTLDMMYQVEENGSHVFHTIVNSDGINRPITETLRMGFSNGNKFISIGYPPSGSDRDGLIASYGDEVHGPPVIIQNTGTTSPTFVQFNKWRVGIRGSSGSLYPTSIFINNVDSNVNFYYISNGSLLVGRNSAGNNYTQTAASISIAAGDNIGRGTLCLGSSSTSTNNWSMQSSNGSFNVYNGNIESSPTNIMTLTSNGNLALNITTGTLQSRYFMSYTGTFNITAAGTYYITTGNYNSGTSGLSRTYAGKLIAYIKPASGTSFMWAAQADVVSMQGSGFRAFMANTSYHTSGSGITALLQPYGGVNSTVAVTDSPANAYQVNVSAYSTTSVLTWTLCNFTN